MGKTCSPAGKNSKNPSPFVPPGRARGSGGRGASGLIPVLHGDTVYAAERGGDVMAFDAQTGATRWSVNIDLVLTGGPGTNGKIVVLGTENGEISALDASTGSIIWETRVSSEVLAPPRLAEGVIIIRSVDGKLSALDAETGDVRWNYDRSVPVLSLRGTSARPSKMAWL